MNNLTVRLKLPFEHLYHRTSNPRFEYSSLRSFYLLNEKVNSKSHSYDRVLSSVLSQYVHPWPWIASHNGSRSWSIANLFFSVGGFWIESQHGFWPVILSSPKIRKVSISIWKWGRTKILWELKSWTLTLIETITEMDAAPLQQIGQLQCTHWSDDWKVPQ